MERGRREGRRFFVNPGLLLPASGYSPRHAKQHPFMCNREAALEASGRENLFRPRAPGGASALEHHSRLTLGTGPLKGPGLTQGA